MNYGSEPADQVVRYSLEGAEFALRISGTAAKNFFIFAQAVLHDSKKTHGKTHLIRLLKEQKPLKFFTVDKDRMHDFACAAKAHGLLFCPIRDKMDPDASPSEPFSDSSKSFANSPSPRADLLRAKGERPSVRMELQDITAYLRNRAEAPKDRMPKLPVKIRRKEKVM